MILFNALFGSMLLLFFPGFFVTLIFSPKHGALLCDKNEMTYDQHELDVIERITLAVLLSITISSVVVFVLYSIFSTSKLTPHNLALAIIFVNMISGAVAAWKQKWLTFVQIFPVAAFPFAVFVLHQWKEVALTINNLIFEFLALVIVFGAVFIVTRLIGKRLIPK